MKDVARYMQVHLAGAAAGIDLFGLSGRRILDDKISTEVLRIREELVDERQRLVRMVEEFGGNDPVVLSLATRLGAQIVRLGPAGNWRRRTPLTDLVVLETMRDAVAGKIAGWQALLTVVEEHPALDREELEWLLAQGEEQHDTLTRAHQEISARVLANEEARQPQPTSR